MFNFSQDVKRTMFTADLKTLRQYQQQATTVPFDTDTRGTTEQAPLQQSGVSSQQHQQIGQLNAECMQDVQTELSEAPQEAVLQQLNGSASALTGRQSFFDCSYCH